MSTAFSRSAANRISINEYSWLHVKEGRKGQKTGETVELTFLVVGQTGLEIVLRGITLHFEWLGYLGASAAMQSGY